MFWQHWPVVATLFLTCSGTALAQEPLNLDAPEVVGAEPDPTAAAPLWSTPPSQEPSMASPTWRHPLEVRRHLDAKEAVQRKAERKAAERAQRLAAQQWYGLSNQRPTASSVPFMGNYSPSYLGVVNGQTSWTGFRRPLPPPLSLKSSPHCDNQ